MVRKFIRRDSNRYSKLGKGRKKLQKWRKPTGRDNKMREKRHGYPKLPSVGYKKPKKEAGKIENLIPVIVRNDTDLKNIDNKKIIIIGKVGAKKKHSIIKKAGEMKLKIFNLNRGIVKNATR